MADPKTESDLAVEKLKDLEKTLSQELDQQVRLVEPTDVRLTGSVALNPSFEIKPKKKETDLPPAEGTAPSMPQSAVSSPSLTGFSPPPAMAPTKADDGEVSLQDVDNILNDLDEGFKQSMDDIKNGISEIEIPSSAFESIAIGRDYLDEGKQNLKNLEVEQNLPEIEDDLFPEEFTKKDSLQKILKKLVFKSFSLPKQILLHTITEAKSLRTESPKAVIFRYPRVISPVLNEWFQTLKETGVGIFDLLRSYSPKIYGKILFILILSGGTIMIVKDIAKNFGSDKIQDPFLRSFKEVAKEEILIPFEDAGEVDSPLKQPEFVVYLPKITSNLKVPSPRYTSMITVELFVEASGQDTAIEIQNRQVEIKDLIERIAEQTTFDDLDNRQGKEKFKSRVVTALNHILNHGRAKKCFFKSLQIKK